MSEAARGGRDRPPSPEGAADAVFLSKAHALAYERLGFAAKSRAPLTLFLGEPGTGRTLLIGELVRNRRSGAAIGLIAEPQALEADPAAAVTAAFGGKPGAGLSETLDAVASAQETPLLVIDDADRLSENALTAVLGLLPGGATEAGALKLVLVGAPDFSERIEGDWPDLVGPGVRLTGMAPDDAAAYLRQRLDAAGARPDLFAEDALAELVELTGGVPGRINALCDACLKKAALAGSERIDRKTVRQAVLASDIGKLAESIARGPKPREERLVLGKPLAAAPSAPLEAEPAPATECPEPGLRLEKAMEKIRAETRGRGKAAIRPSAPTSPDDPVAPKPADAPARDDSPVAAGPTPQATAPEATEPVAAARGRRLVLAGVLLLVASLAAVVWFLPEDRLRDLAATAGLDARDTQAPEPADAAGRESGPADTPTKNAAVTPQDLDPESKSALSAPSDIAAADVPATATIPSEEAQAPAPAPEEAAQPETADAATRDRLDRLRAAMADYPASAEDRFRFAIDRAGADPLVAVAGYAGAALLGHRRAAYYLGQIYQTGDGVAVDRALARDWYSLAATEIAGAAALLEALAPPEVAGEPSAPLPLFAGPAGPGQVDLIWTSAEGPDPAGYRIELARETGEILATSAVETLSALRMDLPEAARLWRVVALGDGDVAVASPWVPILASPE